MNRLTLKKLVFTSEIPDKKPAIVDFQAGFNVISGPSDTGKTLIFECLNYVLGGSSRPKEPPEAKGYTNLFLTIAAGDKDFTLERSVLSHDMKVYDCDYNSITKETVSTVLSGSAKNKENISYYLLNLVGLNDKKLKRNKYNETASLTFNVLRNLLLVNEIKIQEKASPIYTGGTTTKTQEESLFRFMLTGIDYSNIIVQQRPEIRKADANARIRLLQQLIGSLDFKKDMSKEELEEQQKKLTITIEGDTNKIFQNQKEMEDLCEERKAAYDAAISAESKMDQLTEILSRFMLLAQHYQTDLDRLDAIIETGNGLSLMGDVHCPVCGSEPIYHQPECVISEKEISEIKVSCEREKKKINSQKADLAKTIAQVGDELNDFVKHKESNQAEYKRIDALVSKQLEPQLSVLKNNLRRLFETKKNVEIMINRVDQVKVMEDLKVTAEKDLKNPPKAASIATGLQASEASELVKIIEEILADWGYPNLGRVAFSEIYQDIIIGDKNRSEQGKGYRAITHAAFMISLMKFCINKKMPHPGFVVLDSPLVTYRGADTNIIKDEAISDDMKEKFYTKLCNIQNDMQVIVLENDDPPASTISKMNYIPFTKEPTLGRVGFIPVPVFIKHI